MFTGLLIAFALTQVPTELQNYLALPAPEFRWTVVRRDGDRTDLSVLSHAWHGHTMRHGVSVLRPSKDDHPGVAMLIVTGGDVNEKDVAEARTLARESGMVVATVFDIPNQPLFGEREDGLIATTFVKFLETGDATWPLLFPMVKGTLHAMDAVEQWSETGRPALRKFVVTGASKRGWTSWLVGASGDPRVIGIAPEVYDNLDILPQMKHQVEAFGGYSERIGDYTSKDLIATLETEAGQKLARMVDPLSYVSKISIPVLLVTGTNDPYWPADAMSLYWNKLPMPKWARILPNNGHTFQDKDLEHAALAAFARSCAGEFAMPSVAWDLKIDGEAAVASFDVDGQGMVACRIWTAGSASQDFRASVWKEAAKVQVDPPSTESGKSRPAIRFVLPAEPWKAILAEVSYRRAGRTFSVCLPVRVVGPGA
ncbi:MAG: hypothetical protein H6534_01315 [Chthonomonadaceae bacterium]|nr:hypothetical protein [Chthonomonadaceae bacterium]